MKDEAYEMKGGIISKLKRLRLFSISVCLLCSAIWILCLKNSIANKKIYLFCVILALVSSIFDHEISEIVEKTLYDETNPRLLTIPAILLSTMVPLPIGVCIEVWTKALMLFIL